MAPRGGVERRKQEEAHEGNIYVQYKPTFDRFSCGAQSSAKRDITTPCRGDGTGRPAGMKTRG